MFVAMGMILWGCGGMGKKSVGTGWERDGDNLFYHVTL